MPAEVVHQKPEHYSRCESRDDKDHYYSGHNRYTAHRNRLFLLKTNAALAIAR
jgi:hypothetical protein